MPPRVRRLDAVRNGRPVVEIDEELLRRIEQEDGDEIVTSKEKGETMKQDAPKREASKDVVKPKLTDK